MAPRSPHLRIVLPLVGAATLLAGVVLVAASFAFESAYLRNHRLAVAWAQMLAPPNQPLIYPGYESHLEESAIRLMNVGVWTGGAGTALLILGRPRRHPLAPSAST